MVDSTLGSSTKTGWKRRSSALSFSRCLRYSSRVVAPMQRTPRARAGLSMASVHRASALPAPTRGGASSMKRMTCPSARCTTQDGLERSSTSASAPATRAARFRERTRLFRDSGMSRYDSLRDPLNECRLAYTRLTDEHRIVLRAPGEDLQRSSDLLISPDHRVHLPLAGQLGQISCVLLEGLIGLLRIGAVHPPAAAQLGDGLLDLLLLETRLGSGPGERRHPCE